MAKKPTAPVDETLLAYERPRDDSRAITSPAPASASILEYRPGGGSELWRVEKWAEFVTEFNFSHALTSGATATAMAMFDEAAQVYPRGWMLCRRLFGIAPMLPGADVHPDDMRSYSRRELCENLGITNEELTAELDALRAVTAERRSQTDATTTERQSQTAATSSNPPGGLEFRETVLEKHGFPESMFSITTWSVVRKVNEERPQRENRLERDWFAKRVKEWDKMLDEPMAHALTREALMNELYLRRLQTEMAVLSPGSPQFKDLHSTKRNLEQTYQEQLEKLQGMFPESSIAGKISFRAVISDFSKGYREYVSSGSTALIDKVRTAAEIEVELRQSLQAPEVRYRFGLNIAIVEARQNLYNPKFRSQLNHRMLRKLDVGFARAVEELRAANSEPLVDLEKGVMPGEGGEFEELEGGVQ